MLSKKKKKPKQNDFIAVLLFKVTMRFLTRSEKKLSPHCKLKAILITQNTKNL